MIREARPYLRVCSRLAGAVVFSLAVPFALFGQQTVPSANNNLVFLDAGHGGTDTGAHLSDKLLEKDVNLALAAKLKAVLTAKGLSVLSARDGDAVLTSDQRADLANHARPLACVLLHATSSGSGTYVSVSGLAPETGAPTVLPWETAQASYMTDSLALEGLVVGALTNVAKLKPVELRASVPPIDSLTCPAVLLELAPLSGGTPASDADYQQRIVDALTQALMAWHAQALDAVAKAKAAAQAARGGMDPGKAASGAATDKNPEVPKPPRPRVVKPVTPAPEAMPPGAGPNQPRPGPPTAPQGAAQ